MHAQAWKRADATRGAYLSLAQLVLEEGGPNGWGDAEALKGVWSLVQRALAMGGSWARVHPKQAARFS